MTFALLALALLGQLPPAMQPAGPEGPIFSQPGVAQAVAPCAQGALAYSLFADAGDQSSFSDLCDTYAGGFDGGYWCLRPDGGVTGAAMSITGAVTSETHSVCANGAYCGNETRQRFGATGEYVTGNVASPTQDFTICAVFTPDALASRQLLSKLTSNVVQLVANASGGVNFTVSKSGGSTALASSNSIYAARTRNILCGRYSFVADGTSTQNIWLNGAAAAGSTPSTTAVGPPLVASNPWRVHAAVSAVTGTVSNAFYTPVYFSDAALAAMADSALGKTTPTLGTAPTVTRSTVKRCLNTASSEVTVNRINEACITKGGIHSGGAATNLVLQSSVLSTTWTLSNMTCVNTARHPDGTLLASRCTATGANASACQTVTVASALRATSMFLKHPTGVGIINVSRDNLVTPIDVTASLNASTYFRVTPATHAGLSTTSANPTICVQAVTSGDVVDVALVQDEVGATATPPIETTTVSVARTADVVTYPTPLGSNPPAWCIGSTLAPDGPWGTQSGTSTGRRTTLLGTSAGAANSALLTYTSVTRVPALQVYSTGAVLKQMAGDAVAADSTTHRLVGSSTCGELALYLDGVSAGTTSTGTGTGLVLTQPALVNITDVSAGSQQASGVVSNIKQGAGTTVCQ